MEIDPNIDPSDLHKAIHEQPPYPNPPAKPVAKPMDRHLGWSVVGVLGLSAMAGMGTSSLVWLAEAVEVPVFWVTSVPVATLGLGVIVYLEKWK